MVIDNVDGIDPALRDEWTIGFLVDLERLIEERRGERKVLFGVEGSRAFLALLDCDVREAGRFSGEIIRATYPLTGFLPPPKPGLSVGIASTQTGEGPPDGELTLDTLLRVAQEGAEVAVAGGGGRWVHTELYGLVQRRLELGRSGPSPGSQRTGGDHREPEAGGSERNRPHAEEAPPGSAVPLSTVESEPEVEKEPDLPRPDRVASEPAHSEPEAREEPPAVTSAGTSAAPAEAEAGWREIRPSSGVDPAIARWREQSDALHEGAGAEGGLMDVLVAALGQVGLNRSERAAAERALLPLLSDYVRSERARSRDESRERVRTLERRIQKLRTELERVERAQRPSYPVEEHGLASTFRAVQGLNQADEQYELKSSLLEAILHANLELTACTARK